MTLTLMSVFQTHAKMVGNVLMRQINTSVCVPMASLGSTVKPTLMNACRFHVFMGGTNVSSSFKKAFELFQIVLFASTLTGHINCMLRDDNVTHL